ncbi:MAG: hypothetical protein ACJ76F_09130 [Bacteroidia bacterium]
MKTKRIMLALAALTFASAVLFSSCRKDNKKDEEKDSDTSAASDNAMAENTSSDIMNIGSQSMDNGSLTTYKMMPGGDDNLLTPMFGTVTITPNLTAKTVTVTFASYIGTDGHLRNGTVLFNYSQSTNNAIHYRDSGLYVSVTTPTNDYYVDGNQVKIISKTIQNKGRVTNNNMTWAINAHLSIVKANNGGTIDWNCSRTQVLLNTNATTYNGASLPAAYNGSATPISWTTALVGISGTANGTTAAGDSFNATVSSQLVRNFNCSPDPNHIHRHPFVQGSIDFTPGTKATRHIDFGNGTCDLNAAVTINGTTYNITLP